MTKLCRLCYKKSDALLNIFECTNTELVSIIFRCTNIQISKNDYLTKEICSQCIQIITQFDLYRKHCHYVDRILKESCQNKNLDEYANVNNDQKFQIDSVVNIASNGKTEYVLSQNVNQVQESQIRNRNRDIVYELDDTIKKIIGNNVYVCDICKKEFSFFFDYQDHQDSHNGCLEFKCNKCEEIFDTRERLVDHDSRHKVSCHLCFIEVLPKSMPAHLLIHTDIFKCTECGVRSNSNASLKKHIKARHIGVKGFVCHICGKQSSCQSSMRRHMGFHSTDRPFQCQYCDFCAKSMNIIKVHTARRHFAEKCVCDICAKIFKSQPSLLQHRKRIHSNQKHVCDICGKAFIEKYILTKHMKRHVGQRLYECKLCNKEFFTVRTLKEHMHSHRQGCVNCPKCGKEFFYKKYYSKHVFKCTKTDTVGCSDVTV
ncbi:hypothetical protein RN001_006453 [Aquatica leii]|uniref:Uncharacterized protein n=1 Tax=Aquatica leii TaxID=1421715 RepID=A0AAN7PDP6_9COLE|nr:hypothetical protein RN001_006453 [Aquatica leii]